MWYTNTTFSDHSHSPCTPAEELGSLPSEASSAPGERLFNQAYELMGAPEGVQQGIQQVADEIAGVPRSGSAELAGSPGTGNIFPASDPAVPASMTYLCFLASKSTKYVSLQVSVVETVI